MKMEYTGPGAKRTLEVQEHEVAALEKTGLWKKAAKKTKSSEETDEKKGSDS